MIIYIDFILFLNFFFDFTLLLGVSVINKNKINFINIFISSLIGSISILIQFLNLGNFILIIYNFIISIILILVSFGIKNYIKNIITLYVLSIFLGGFIYFLNNMFSYKIDGLIFINKGLSINILLMIILTPFIIYIYIKEYKYNKILKNVYNVKIKYKNKLYEYRGFLDSGNNLYDPYFHKPICILYDKRIKYDKSIIVIYNTLSDSGILNCVKADELIIDNNIFYNVYIGLSDKKFILNNCDMIIHKDFI